MAEWIWRLYCMRRSRAKIRRPPNLGQVTQGEKGGYSLAAADFLDADLLASFHDAATWKIWSREIGAGLPLEHLYPVPNFDPATDDTLYQVVSTLLSLIYPCSR